MNGVLYIVATPIGNREDITLRAVRVLSEADIIAAEDTRHSGLLLSHLNIKTPLASCHKFNEAERVDFFIRALQSGKNIALISDAGTPCLSDPGYRLIKKAAEAGIEITAVCGPSAVAAALSVSGFDASAFIFLGFLPKTQKGLAEALKSLEKPVPTIFFESPKRIIPSLRRIGEIYPHTELCLCNDLTKKFERIYRGKIREVIAELTENPHAGKGEYTCAALNREPSAPPAGIELGGPFTIEGRLADIMARENVSLKEAARIFHEKNNSISKKEIYAASVRLKSLIS